jgi:allantoinase
MQHDLLVRGDVVSGGRVIPSGGLAISRGRIAAVLDAGSEVDAAWALDASGKLVVPGVVDSHVHTLSTPTEGIATATAAAAAGGVTTVIDMPYDSPDPVIDAARFAAKTEAVEREAHVDVALYATIAKVDGVEAIPELLDAGAVAFKMSTFETDPARFPRIGDADLRAAFALLAPSGVPVVIHAEAQDLVEPLLARALAAGEQDPDAHARTRPVESETLALGAVAELALWSGARVHVAHVTHPHGFRLLDWYRTRGARVSGETCVHYLCLDAGDVERLGGVAKVNPPIRDRDARDGLWQAIGAGSVATVSTDHAPWPEAAKRRPMLEAASGIPGLETFLPLMLTEGRRRGMTVPQLMDLVAARPAALFGLPRKGRLEVGFDADFAVVDREARWRFDAARAQTSAGWSPFHGAELVGRVESTWVRGCRVWDGEAITARPGFGSWLRRG